MKKLVVAVGLFIGLVGISHASGGGIVFTSTYVGVCVTGSSFTSIPAGERGEMELLSVEYSSGSSSPADSYLLLLDTPTIFNNNAPNSDPVPFGSAYTVARFPNSQLITPPIVLFSTSGGAVNINGYYNRIDFTDAQGNGRPINGNLVVFKQGTDYGTTYTIITRKRRQSTTP